MITKALVLTAVTAGAFGVAVTTAHGPAVVTSLSSSTVAPTASTSATASSTLVPDPAVPSATITSYPSSNQCAGGGLGGQELPLGKCVNLLTSEAEEFKYTGGASVLNITVFEETGCSGVNATRKLNAPGQCFDAVDWFVGKGGEDGVLSTKTAGSVCLECPSLGKFVV